MTVVTVVILPSEKEVPTLDGLVVSPCQFEQGPLQGTHQCPIILGHVHDKPCPDLFLANKQHFQGKSGQEKDAYKV